LESILQRDFKAGKDVITLPTGEFRESLTIDRPCTIVGSNTTLWNESNPVLMVRSSGVTLKNLKLELNGISGYDDDYATLQLNPDTIVENVEIYGGVADTKKYYIPRAVHLGNFKPNTENTFKLEVYLPETCDVRVKSSNFKVYSSNHGDGYYTLTIVTNPLESNAMLYGEIVLTSKLIRRIFVDGVAVEDAPLVDGKVLYSHDTTHTLNYSEVFAVSVQKVNTNPQPLETKTLKRGERCTLDYPSLTMLLKYDIPNSAKLDIDPYIFLTDENNSTIYTTDMLFFGNTATTNGSVRIAKGGKVSMQLDRVPTYVKKVCVCYSIYKRKLEPLKTFSSVKNLGFSIYTGNFELFKFQLDGLENFSTIILAEFYRYNGRWKINPVVHGYHGNLPQMCKSFGIDATY
jgi:stress response protein SCP2